MLNKGQQEIHDKAVNWFLDNNSDQIFQIAGGAGTGKTYLLKEILKTLNLTDTEILPMAYTGAASLVLRRRGFINACTIHSSLYNPVVYYIYDYDEGENTKKDFSPKKKIKFELKETLPSYIRLLIVDEAFMVPLKMYNDMRSFGIKIIATGDPNQLPPVGGSPIFFNNEFPVYTLTEIMRQELNNPIVLLAFRSLSKIPIGRGIYGPNLIVIDEHEFRPEFFNYADIILTNTVEMRERINHIIRHLKGFTSPLPYPGEKIICRKNNWDILIPGAALVNGLVGTCNSMPIICEKRDQFEIDFSPEIIPDLNIHLNLNYKYFISNRQIREQMIGVQAGRFINGNLFEFAYALTVHLSQGNEYDRGIIFEEFDNNWQAIYTAITRFKKSIIYVKKSTPKFDFINI